MSRETPDTFNTFVDRFPEIWEAQETGAKAVEGVGPLDRKTRELIKIGICLGANLQTALRRHVHQAIASGAPVSEVEQAILLGINTIGFPSTMIGWKAAHDQIREHEKP